MRGSNRKKGKSSKGQATELPSTALIYNGPIRQPSRSIDNTLTTQELRLVVNLTASAAGVITPLWGNPNVASEWSNFAALYEEFRVEGMRAEYVPFYPRWGPTGALALNMGGVVWYPLRNAAVLAGSSAAAYAYAGAIPKSIQDGISLTNRMSQANEASFQNTTAPLATFAIAAFGSGFTNNGAYGTMYITWLVQFRSRF